MLIMLTFLSPLCDLVCMEQEKHGLWDAGAQILHFVLGRVVKENLHFAEDALT